MFSILVLKLGLTPKYVLDEMEMYEMKALLKYQYLKFQEYWDMSRTIALYGGRLYGSKKTTKITDIAKFQWDLEGENRARKRNQNLLKTENDLKRFENDYRRLEAKAKAFLNNNILN